MAETDELGFFREETQWRFVVYVGDDDPMVLCDWLFGWWVRTSIYVIVQRYPLITPLALRSNKPKNTRVGCQPKKAPWLVSPPFKEKKDGENQPIKRLIGSSWQSVGVFCVIGTDTLSLEVSFLLATRVLFFLVRKIVSKSEKEVSWKRDPCRWVQRISLAGFSTSSRDY